MNRDKDRYIRKITIPLNSLIPNATKTSIQQPLRSIQHSMCSSHHLRQCYITSVGRSLYQTVTKPSDMKACYNTYHIPFQSSTNLCCTLPYLKHHCMGGSSWSQAAIPARLAELGPLNSIFALTLHLLHAVQIFHCMLNMAAHTSKRQPMLAIHMAHPERPHGRTDLAWCDSTCTCEKDRGSYHQHGSAHFQKTTYACHPHG